MSEIILDGLEANEKENPIKMPLHLIFIFGVIFSDLINSILISFIYTFNYFLIYFYLLILMDILILYGLWNFKNWGRRMAIIVALSRIAMEFYFLSFLESNRILYSGVNILISVYLIIYFNQRKVKQLFEKTY